MKTSRGRKKRKVPSNNEIADVDQEGTVEAEVLIHTEEISLNATNEENLQESTIENAEDPLEEQTQQLKEDSIYFNEFNEDDFLVEDEVRNIEEEEAPKSVGRKKKHKRLPIQNSAIRGANGFLWTTDVSAELSALAVPAALKPTSKGPTRRVSNPLEAWQLLIDEHILMPILKYTNDEIRRRPGKNRPMDPTELRAWLGLNYLGGIFHNSPHSGPLDELWTAELGNAVFRSSMTLERFHFIFDCIRFSSTSHEETFDCVFNLWHKFLINCRSYYTPSGNCVIDEYILQTTDPQCPLQCALPGNESEQGLRVITMCDAKTLYICNALVARSEAIEELEVLTLVQDIKCTKRHISLPERYTTMPLVDKLQQCSLACIGALPTTAPELPTAFLGSKNACNLYAGEKALLTGLSPVENPTGFLLTCSMPQTINARKLYGRTRKAGQRLYEMLGKYSTAFAIPANINRWTLNSLHAILDYAVFNAWVIYQLSEANSAKITQRDFQRQLGLYLTQQQLLRRADRNLPLLLKVQVGEMLGQPTAKLLGLATKTATQAVCEGVVARANQFVPKDVVLASKYFLKRKRCRICRGAGSPKTRMHCQQCMTPLCGRHLIQRCDDCLGVLVMPPESPLEALNEVDVLNEVVYEAVESEDEEGEEVDQNADMQQDEFIDVKQENYVFDEMQFIVEEQVNDECDVNVDESMNENN